MKIPSLHQLSLAPAPTATRKGKEKASAPAPAPAEEPEPEQPNWFLELPPDLQELIWAPYLIDRIGDLATTEKLSVEDLCKILGSLCRDLGNAHPMCQNANHKAWEDACGYLGMFVKFTDAHSAPMSWRATFNQMCDMLYWYSLTKDFRRVILEDESPLMSQLRFLVVGLRRGTLPSKSKTGKEWGWGWSSRFGSRTLDFLGGLVNNNWGLRQLLKQLESFLEAYENAYRLSTASDWPNRSPLEWVRIMREYLSQWQLEDIPEPSPEIRWMLSIVDERLSSVFAMSGVVGYHEESGAWEPYDVNVELFILDVVRHAIVAGANLERLGAAIAGPSLGQYNSLVVETFTLLLNAGMRLDFLSHPGHFIHGLLFSQNFGDTDHRSVIVSGVSELVTRLFKMGVRLSNNELDSLRVSLRTIWSTMHPDDPERPDDPVKTLQQLLALVKAMNSQGMKDDALLQAIEVALQEGKYEALSESGGAGPSGVNPPPEDDADADVTEQDLFGPDGAWNT